MENNLVVSTLKLFIIPGRLLFFRSCVMQFNEICRVVTLANEYLNMTLLMRNIEPYLNDNF